MLHMSHHLSAVSRPQKTEKKRRTHRVTSTVPALFCNLAANNKTPANVIQNCFEGFGVQSMCYGNTLQKLKPGSEKIQPADHSQESTPLKSEK